MEAKRAKSMGKKAAQSTYHNNGKDLKEEANVSAPIAVSVAQKTLSPDTKTCRRDEVQKRAKGSHGKTTPTKLCACKADSNQSARGKQRTKTKPQEIPSLRWLRLRGQARKTMGGRPPEVTVGARGARPKTSQSTSSASEISRKTEKLNKTHPHCTPKAAGISACKDTHVGQKKAKPATRQDRAPENEIPLKKSPAIEDMPNQPFIDLFKRKVQLTRDDISTNSKLVEETIDKLLEGVKDTDELFTLTRLNAGSYYEKLKVSRPVEFDVMVVLKAQKVSNRFQISCPTGRSRFVGYARLKYLAAHEWYNYVSRFRDGLFLSPIKLRKRFLYLLKKSIKKVKERTGVCQLTAEANGPAAKVNINGKIDVDVVLSLEVEGWPASANGWGQNATTRTWPSREQVTKVFETQRYFLVAKDLEFASGGQEDKDGCGYWRISFSETEKFLLLRNVSGSDGSEKKYFRIVKYIFEAEQEQLKPLSSYHLKTLFCHCRSKHAGKPKCSDSALGRDVLLFLQELLHCVKSGELPHFFISRLNLLSKMDRGEKGRLVEKLNDVLSHLTAKTRDYLADLTVV